MSSLFSFILFAQTTSPAAAPAAAPAAGAAAAGSTPVAPTGGGNGMMTMVLVYGLLFAAMYFFMIAPQRKKQKEHQKLLSSLQSGDEIMTNGGIYGVITNVKEDRFVVRISDSTKIEVAKGFVQAVVKKSDSSEKK